MKTLIILLLLTLTTISFNSCSVKFFSKYMTEERGAIPPEFGRPNEILLCEITEIRGRDKYIVKAFRSNYNAKVEFVTAEDLKENFTDKDIYRYIIVDEIVNNFDHTSHRLHVKDRVSDSLYYCSVSSGYFAGLYQALAIRLEEKRVSQEN